MKTKENRLLIRGLLLILIFAVWTVLIMTVDVKPIGQNGTDVGFSVLNTWFHKLTGVNMMLYNITDWLGFVPVFICMGFAGFGFFQLIKRKSLLRVDGDIILLGIYFITVIFFYLIFEEFPINYRPILIEGRMEASYPSSTTLLVLSVMPVFSFQAEIRIKKEAVKKLIRIFVITFSLFMVIGRLVSGVHWLTDIIGSLFISAGLYFIYNSLALRVRKK